MGFFDFFRKKINESKNPPSTVVATISTSNVKNNVHPIYQNKLRNNLLPGEVLLLNWIKNKSIDAPSPAYFEYTYGIETKSRAIYLVDEGYLRYAKTIEALPSLKLVQLKELLKLKGLKVSGNKNDLINRIVENYSMDDISQHIPSRPLLITSLGEETLKEYYFIIHAHQNNTKDGIYDVAKVLKYTKNTNQTPDINKIFLDLHKVELVKQRKRNSFGVYTNTLRNLALFHRKENNYRESIEYYLQAFIISLSGLSNSDYILSPNRVFIDYPSAERSLEMIELLDITEDEAQDFFYNAWARVRPELPFHLLNKEVCYKCFKASLQGEQDYILEKLNKSFSKINPDTFDNNHKVKYPYFHNKI